MLRYHLQLQWSTCQLRLYYQEGGSRLQPPWGSSINFIGLGCARLMLRVNEKSEENQVALTDTSILLRAWLASLDSLTLIWYISPRLKARYINGKVTPTAIICLCYLNFSATYREQVTNHLLLAKYGKGFALPD